MLGGAHANDPTPRFSNRSGRPSNESQAKICLPRSQELSTLESTKRSAKDAGRIAVEHAELDDVAGDAIRESHRELEDQVVGRGHDPTPDLRPRSVGRILARHRVDAHRRSVYPAASMSSSGVSCSPVSSEDIGAQEHWVFVAPRGREGRRAYVSSRSSQSTWVHMRWNSGPYHGAFICSRPCSFT